MVANREVEVLVKRVQRLSKSVKALSAEIHELAEVLQKQNDWLAELAGILRELPSGEDDVFEKESDEWKRNLEPKN
jgi:hypothetical protein